MTDDSTCLLADVLEVLQDLGTTATLVSVTKTYAGKTSGDMDGTVSEATTTETIDCALTDEVTAYGTAASSQAVTGTLHVAAKDLDATPTIEDRVLYQSRTFSIQQVATHAIEGVTVAYTLAVAELGAT